MDNAVLNSGLIATKMRDITVYNYSSGTQEYISISTEYLAIGVGIPACSCLDILGTYKAGYAICRSADLNSWGYMPNHRGEIVYNTGAGDSKETAVSGDHPKKITITAPLTPHDKWDGEKWVTDTKTQCNAAVDAAGLQCQPLTDDAMSSIVLIQLKLQAGRKLTAGEIVRPDSVSDYIDVVAATDISTAPDINWSKSPEI